VNTVLLEKAISDSGLKKKFIAQKLGMSEQTFNKKRKNGTFYGDEVIDLCNILNISGTKTASDIFLP
jgi:hypothetical protein